MLTPTAMRRQLLHAFLAGLFLGLLLGVLSLTTAFWLEEPTRPTMTGAQP